MRVLHFALLKKRRGSYEKTSHRFGNRRCSHFAWCHRNLAVRKSKPLSRVDPGTNRKAAWTKGNSRPDEFGPLASPISGYESRHCRRSSHPPGTAFCSCRKTGYPDRFIAADSRQYSCGFVGIAAPQRRIGENGTGDVEFFVCRRGNYSDHAFRFGRSGFAHRFLTSAFGNSRWTNRYYGPAAEGNSNRIRSYRFNPSGLFRWKTLFVRRVCANSGRGNAGGSAKRNGRSRFGQKHRRYSVPRHAESESGWH